MRYLSLSIPGFPNIDTGNPNLTPLPSGVPTGGLETTGQRTIQAFIIFIVIVAILFALWNLGKGGLDIIQSRGLKEKVKSGRERVMFGFIGLIMFFLSFFFINVIGRFFGFDLLPFLKFW